MQVFVLNNYNICLNQSKLFLNTVCILKNFPENEKEIYFRRFYVYISAITCPHNGFFYNSRMFATSLHEPLRSSSLSLSLLFLFCSCTWFYSWFPDIDGKRPKFSSNWRWQKRMIFRCLGTLFKPHSLKIDRIISKCFMTECHDWVEECRWFCDSVAGLVSELYFQFCLIFKLI